MANLFPGVQAILFDFDGTLVEPSIDFELMRERVLDVVSRYGVDASDWEMLPVLEIMEHVVEDLESARAESSAVFLEEAHQAVLAMELEAAARVRPYVGVPSMLQKLESCGYVVGIVTRNSRQAVQHILDRVPLCHRALFTRDDVRYVKPDPRHLLSALDALGMNGARALMCGDHPMDILAGKGIGASTVAVLRPGVQHAYFDEVAPDLILDRVTDLLDYLGEPS